MNEDIKSMWKQAEETGEKISIGDMVICDICDREYTHSEEEGGFIFSGKAYCPRCAVRGLETIRRYNEEKFIEARCPEGTSFADFVRAYRGDENYIQITKIKKGDK